MSSKLKPGQALHHAAAAASAAAMSLRKLKHHEKKLLRKTNLLDWRAEKNVHRAQVLRRYHVQDAEDYTRYNKIAGMITKVTADMKTYSPDDPFRIRVTEQLLARLYDMGLITSKKSLIKCEEIPVSAFCRRRLPVVMARLKMAQTLREAVTFVEQGHVRVGPEVVTDPSFLVTRPMEDFVTWSDRSSIRRTVATYNDERDDYELNGA